jgi:hypothetical protein
VRIPQQIYSDRGTETVEVYTVHTSFHALSLSGNFADCWKYGRSVQNQKIECFWSQFLNQHSGRWREIFHDLEWSGLWQYDDEIDKIALLYIYMPILRAELTIFRQEYNQYPIRYNHLSRLPYGPPYDNFFGNDDDLSIPIETSWLRFARQDRLPPDFDPEEYLDPTICDTLDRHMLNSPLGSVVHVGNARDQYLFLRGHLRRTEG